MNRTTFLSEKPNYPDIMLAISANIGNTTESIRINFTHPNDHQENNPQKQYEPDEKEFIFVKDTNDFLVQLKQVITKYLCSSDECFITAAHNLDFFLTTHHCFTSFDIDQVDLNHLFSTYRASKELQLAAQMINLDCLFTRFEAHFMERYQEFECKNKSENSKNCILCTHNWYIL